MRKKISYSVFVMLLLLVASSYPIKTRISQVSSNNQDQQEVYMWVCLKQYNPMCMHVYVCIKKNNIMQL